MALKMEGLNSSKDAASIYQKMRHNIPEHFIVCVLIDNLFHASLRHLLHL